jgi:glyoxylase-like metal-dependent hydrolase (beta-lactamase superfamily II)
MSPKHDELHRLRSPGVQAMRISKRLTFWAAPHPAWKPNLEWPEEVGFVTWLGSDSYVLIDPLVRDDLDATAWEPFDRAVSGSGHAAVVLLTAPWHERSARAVAARYEARVWIHPASRARVSELPELRVLPMGVETFVPAGADEGQVAFHIVPERTLVVADLFLGVEGGLRVASAPVSRDAATFATSLDQLRHLPIDNVLVAHGPPVLGKGGDSIAAALDAFAETT